MAAPLYLPTADAFGQLVTDDVQLGNMLFQGFSEACGELVTSLRISELALAELFMARC